MSSWGDHHRPWGTEGPETKKPPAWSAWFFPLCCVAAAFACWFIKVPPRPFIIELPDNHADIVCVEFAQTISGVRWEDEAGRKFSLSFLTRGELDRRRREEVTSDDLPDVCARSLMPLHLVNPAQSR